MDLNPAMRQAVRRVAQAFRRYAETRNWSQYAHHGDWQFGDYFLSIIVNDEWNRINVTLVSKHFRNVNEYQRFEEVQDFLDEDLKDTPELLDSIDLVVRDDQQFDEERSSLDLGDLTVDEEWIEAAIQSA